jgi:phospholipid/cholesterol/gamma-HCH transport system substrate-binding protein
VPITRGTFAQFGTQGLTGIAHIQLDDDHSDPAPLLPTGAGPPRIALRGSALDDLAESSKVLLRQANSLLERMNAIASEDNQRRLERTLENFEQASARLEPALAAIPEVAERARRLLGEGNQESIRRSLSNLAEATDAIKPLAEDSRQVMANMRALSEKLDRISTEISIEVSDRTLPKINDLVDQLDRDSRDFRRLVLQIEREPQSLLFGRAPVAPGPGEPGFREGRK